MKQVLMIFVLLTAANIFGQQTAESQNSEHISFASTRADSMHQNLFLEMEQSNTVDYYYELIKFYITEQEFDLALSYLDSISSNMTDSLYYFKGLSFQGKEEWENAAASFGNCITTHRHQELLDAASLQLEAVLKNLSALSAIEQISGIINKLEDGDLLAQFLFIMARVYEQNQLFEEANDVYKTIIKETDYENKINTKLKIAINHIFLKEYSNAITVLHPVIALNDSIYNKDALFFNYIANYALNNFSVARDDLLRLYQEYPSHPNRIEILQGLAEIFEIEKQYLISWYMRQELLKISSDVQKMVIQQEIDRIKDLLVTEEFTADQFEFLKPNFRMDNK